MIATYSTMSYLEVGIYSQLTDFIGKV